MLPLIAWRNIWRNKLRSLVVMLSISVGIWAGIFSSGLVNGINKERMNNVIETQTSHIQIHHKEFQQNLEINKFIPESEKIKENLSNNPEIKHFTTRTIVSGMVSSAANGKGVMIKGINPEEEANVVNLKEYMEEGNYFEGVKRNPILIGKSLAEKLNVKVRKKVILNFQDENNEIVSAAFRVAGIYKTNDAKNDELSVFIKQKDLNRLLNNETPKIHEIAIILNNFEQLDTTTVKLQEEFSSLEVQSWKGIFPGLDAANQIVGRMNYLLLLILLAALSFGIINTMLMAVLERVREFGMLMAVGMNKTKVFTMIMLETVFLMLTGTPIGILIAYFSIQYFGKNGIDLTKYAEGFNNVGVEAKLYPYLTTDFYPKVIIMVVICAFLAAIYPAYKAIKLNPAEAIRKI